MEYFRTILYTLAAVYCAWTVKMGYGEYMKTQDSKIIIAMVGFSLATIVIGFLAYREYKYVKSQKEKK